MRKIITTTAALLATTTMVQAGGVGRSGQPVNLLFADGNVAELSFGIVKPSVSGAVGGGAVGSGNMAPQYTQIGAGIKMDVNDQVSLALIVDQPFGANIDYTDANALYPLAGTKVELRSTGISALARYKLNENFSVHGGLRMVSLNADLNISASGVPLPYDAKLESASGVGFVIGAAYEVPEIALRAALTFSSSIDIEQTVKGTSPLTLGAPFEEKFKYKLPQSVNLDLQTGIAEDTLLFGSIRWVDWTETEVNAPNYFANPLLGYDDDTYTVTIGVGRKFSEQFSGMASFSYEKSTGELADNLAPTDGRKSITVGGSYKVSDAVTLSGGVNYTWLGDATTEAPISGQFKDNNAFGIGLKVAYNF